MKNENNPTLRKLNNNEICYVESKYSKDRNFNFLGPSKIESKNDVAYIFKNLQNSSVENFFVAYIKDKKATIQHLSMGSNVGTVVHINAIRDAVNRFQPDNIMIIHNHPSGNLTPSSADYNILNNLNKLYKEKLTEGIIINTISGEYSIFNVNNEHYINSIEKTIENKKYSVLKFDKQLFKEKSYENLKITTAEDVAKYISLQRLGEKEKLSVLMLSNYLEIRANIHLLEQNINEKNINEISNEISSYASRFNSTAAIIYGNFELNKQFEQHYSKLKNNLNLEKISLTDAIAVKHNPEIFKSLENNKEISM